VSSMSVLLRGGTLLPLKDTPRPMWGDLLISGTRIGGLGKVDGLPPDTEVVDVSGCVVMPGIVQTHVHLVQTLFRGLAEDMPLLGWLRTRVWPLEAAHDEASVRASVRLGLLDLLTTGTTTILDMGTTHFGDIVAEELVRSGIRARFGQAMMDTGEGVPPNLVETTRASLDAGGALTKRWHKASSGRIGYVYMPRFTLSCTRELLEAVTQLAKLSDLLVHTHSNESVDERTAVTMATGRTPMQYLLDTGIACERAIIAHGVHLDDSEIEILKTDAEVGTLEQGKRADLVVLDLGKLDGPGGDPVARILFGGGSRAVRHVLVDGEFLVRDGVPTKMDAAEVRAKAAEQLGPLM